MPQISPISWTLVFIVFTLMLMVIKMNLPSVYSKQTVPVKAVYKKKSMKW